MLTSDDQIHLEDLTTTHIKAVEYPLIGEAGFQIRLRNLHWYDVFCSPGTADEDFTDGGGLYVVINNTEFFLDQEVCGLVDRLGLWANIVRDRS